MKQIIVEKCAGCPNRIDFDDGDECMPFDLKLHFPHGGIHDDCELDDYPDYNTRFHNWLTKHFPYIKKEWDIYQETK